MTSVPDFQFGTGNNAPQSGMSPNAAGSSFHRGDPRSSLDRVQTALEHASVQFTKRGDHLQAKCPTHDDGSPSLSIDYKTDGRVFVHCQAGCSPDDVLGALGLTWAELYDDYERPDVYAARRREERAQGINRPSQPARRPQQKTPAKGRLPRRLIEDKIRPLGTWKVTATYDYVDSQGTLLQQEVRSERPIEVTTADVASTQKVEKKFSQRWPDPATSGQWLDKRPADFEPVLYGLPDVEQWVQAGRVIWLCEGVKDVTRFLEQGEAATTNPSGAKNFKASQAQALTGAQVVVVVDHDAAGYSRAIRLHELLADRVDALRFALPRTDGKHTDASDHFDAGHGLNFAEATVEQLVQLERVAIAEDEISKAKRASTEVTARLRRASDADHSDRADELQAAHRWAAETGSSLLKVIDLQLDADHASEALQQRRSRAVDSIRKAVHDTYDATGVDMPADVAAALVDDHAQHEAPTQEVEDPDEPAGGQVVDGPGSERLPEPSTRIPMSRGTWAYEIGGSGRRPRGVYTLNDSRWVRVADLPYIQARIVERDGSGRRTGTQWLASVEDGGPGLIIGWDDLGSGRWANMLNLWVSRDKKVEESTATAFELISMSAPERERTARVDEGRVSVPVPDTLPGGYLITGDLDRDQAIERWREILKTAAQSPRLALVLGASAVAPYVAALRRQSHVVALYGDSDQGKSVTMSVAGAIWGDTLSDGSAVVRPWNSTGNGVIRFLGQLGVLPGFFDEAGQANATTPREWGKLIYDICEGAQRMGAEMRGLGVRVTMPWHGVLVSAGNGRLTDGLGAGRYAGIAKRVIDVETPLTMSAEHAERLTALLPGAVGHLGHEILQRHTADTVAPLIAEAEKVLGMPEGGNERTVARHLHAHLAGAMILDEITGADGSLYYSALAAAVDYMEQWAPPEHDADRMLEAVRDAIGREPAMWPEMDDYIDHKRAPGRAQDGGGPILPAHGVNRTLSGIVRTDHENDTQTVWVFGHHWKALCEELGADSAVACRELSKREVLRRTDSSRRANEWTTKVRATGSKMYELRFGPHLDNETGPIGHANTPSAGDSDTQTPSSDERFTDDGAPEQATIDQIGPVPGESSGCSGPVPGDVPGTNMALTSSVPGVPGKNGEGIHVHPHEDTRPGLPKAACVICGEIASARFDGKPMHLGECALVYEQAAEQPHSEPEPAVETTLELAEPATPEGHTTSAAGPSSTRAARFSAPAACLAADGLHLAGGKILQWPEITHLGDLALLTGRDHLRLGWGGGEDRLPDAGQVWLFTSALERLGLPTSMALPEDRALTKSQRSKETRKMFGKLDDHPLVAGALEAGWQLGQGGHLGVWTRIWHSDLLPGGAFLVGLPWHRIEGVPLFDGDPAPGALADRLATFASHVGVTYRMTAAATGLDLIDHHRPPRRSEDDDLGSGRGRVALVKGVGAELPPWRRQSKDARFNALGQDFSWWRQWDKLGEAERDLRYVHAYDRNASYLSPWQNIDLGVQDLEHREGAAAAWDGKEKPGYYLIEEWQWPAWGLPEPSGAKVGQGRMWVNVHTMKQLAMVGIEPIVHESFTWAVTTRYLAGPGKALSTARAALQDAPEADQTAQPVLNAVKLLYASTVGKLAERDHSDDYHLWRPDWQDHIVSATKTQILRVLSKIHDSTGTSALVVDRDAIFFASNDPDPVTAWPGDPRQLDTKLGAWKPAYSAELEDWGPTYLRKRPGRWPYADATAAMNGPGGV